MKFFDLFAGIGGFRLGMERAGHECVGSCEWDKYARETYNKNFGEYPEYDDVKDLHPQSLPSFDVLCAGFPCQAFSVAGKRLGFEDPRGNIFFEIARIAKVKRPSYLFLENVKGLLSHEKGDTFRTIISTLDEMGYDAEWQVLNSKYFVPQNRERIFIIGHLRGERTRQIFPLGDYDEKTDRKIKKLNDARQGYRVYDTSGIGQTLAANAGGLGAKMGLIAVVNDKKGLREVERATCLDANYFKGHDSHGARTMTKAVLTPDRLEKRQMGRRFKEDGEPSFTVNTQDRHGVMIALTEKRTDEAKQIRKEMRKKGKDWCPRRGKELVPRNDNLGNCLTAGQSNESYLTNGTRIRKLTPTECERLQGFPDGWTIGSDTQRYKQCGNAVTVPVV